MSAMSAHERYAGRFFTKLRHENSEFWQHLRDSAVDVLFVSGLYGLVRWDEPIQNYECHLGDYCEGGTKQTVLAMWNGDSYARAPTSSPKPIDATRPHQSRGYMTFFQRSSISGSSHGTGSPVAVYGYSTGYSKARLGPTFFRNSPGSLPPKWRDSATGPRRSKVVVGTGFPVTMSNTALSSRGSMTLKQSVRV